MKVSTGTNEIGAMVEGFDLSSGPGQVQRDTVEQLIGAHGVLCFKAQRLSALQLRDFSAQFGELEINVANVAQEPGAPEVMTLSNILEDGKPIGLGDAGQGWHTDMSYSRTVAFANVLYALKIPRRNGEPLGATQFSDMAAAYDALPAEIKSRIEGLSAIHDFNKFWEMMRTRPGSLRKPLTDEQRRAKPPVSHPLVLVHPISGRRVLYCNPGYAIRIEGIPQAESDDLLAFLFEHQLQQDFIYTHRWSEGDVLMWDNLRTIHQAIADYRPDEPRLIKRCQVMASRYLPH
ncbi:MAG: TauD/TfdA dioxygenase family protein [Quisquiliibacterium sp.]